MKLIRFTASWCAPCKILEKELEKAKVTILVSTVDVDVNPELAKGYNIRSVPTMILEHNDKTLDRKVGILNAKQIQEWLDGFQSEAH